VSETGAGVEKPKYALIYPVRMLTGMRCGIYNHLPSK
jgi:hypothetical protein